MSYPKPAALLLAFRAGLPSKLRRWFAVASPLGSGGSESLGLRIWEGRPIISSHMAKVATSVISGGLSGSAGTATFVRRANGETIVRPRRAPANPNTLSQQAQRKRLRLSIIAYRSLSQAQAHAWADYATKLAGPGKVLRACDLFNGLAIRFLAVNNGGTIPLLPPQFLFGGDALNITATGGAGTITFSSPSANASGVVTELLLAPVRSWAATPMDESFRHGAFFTYPTGGGSSDVSRPRGRYACAIRFIRSATGQASELLRIGVTEVS